MIKIRHVRPCDFFPHNQDKPPTNKHNHHENKQNETKNTRKSFEDPFPTLSSAHECTRTCCWRGGGVEASKSEGGGGGRGEGAKGGGGEKTVASLAMGLGSESIKHGCLGEQERRFHWRFHNGKRCSQFSNHPTNWIDWCSLSLPLFTSSRPVSLGRSNTGIRVLYPLTARVLDWSKSWSVGVLEYPLAVPGLLVWERGR